MPSSDKKVRVYEELADLENQRGSAQARDRFLILAADAALMAGLTDEAEKFRARLLEHNPHHLLRPYRSLADAMKSSDVYSYIADLRGSYPPDEAEQLLESLKSGKDAGGETATPPLHPALDNPPAGDVLQLKPESPKSEAAGPGTGPSPLLGLLRDPDAAREARQTATLPRTRIPDRASNGEVEPDDLDDEPSGIGVWLSDGLYVLLLVAGVGLAIYTLARPWLNLPDAPLR
jgi:hypothetical protein